MGTGDYAGAVETLKQLIALKPKFYDALFSLGMAYTMMARHDDAINVLQQAIEVKPNSERAVMALGMAYLAKNDKESARRLLARLKELDDGLAGILENALAR
jgi:Flp pilus assembly protein TadD